MDIENYLRGLADDEMQMEPGEEVALVDEKDIIFDLDSLKKQLVSYICSLNLPDVLIIA
jgi:hypothetical protein